MRNDDLNRKWDFNTNPQINPLSRQDVVKDPLQNNVKYKYDGLGRTNSIEQPIKDMKTAVTHYSYDLNNNLKDIEDANNYWTYYEYDSKDRLKDIYYHDQRP